MVSILLISNDTAPGSQAEGLAQLTGLRGVSQEWCSSTMRLSKVED
jgi:hypothetical protein